MDATDARDAVERVAVDPARAHATRARSAATTTARERRDEASATGDGDAAKSERWRQFRGVDVDARRTSRAPAATLPSAACVALTRARACASTPDAVAVARRSEVPPRRRSRAPMSAPDENAVFRRAEN